ncbi:hypothetical protein P3S68_001986 [Capsicum galapagoense]
MDNDDAPPAGSTGLGPKIEENYRSQKKAVVVVLWRKPMQDWCTCNSDGTSKENPGPSSIACCIRNEERDIQYAACRQLSDSTSIFAEAMAMTEGCEYCVENQFLPLFLKTDSLALMKMVKREWESPWNTIMIKN